MRHIFSDIKNGFRVVDRHLTNFSNDIANSVVALTVASAAALGFAVAAAPEKTGNAIADMKTGYTETVALKGNNPHISDRAENGGFEGCPTAYLSPDSPDKENILKEELKLRECNVMYQNGAQLGWVSAKIQGKWATFAAATEKGRLDKGIPIGVKHVEHDRQVNAAIVDKPGV